MSQPRPNKVTVISLGNIGTEVEGLLSTRCAANHISGWNRSAPESEEMGKHHGGNYAHDQSMIINASIHSDGDTPSFSRSFGFENLDSSINGADIVVVTTGAKRTPEMSDRAQLAETNRKIIVDFAARVKANPDAQKATYIIATNPVDSMTQLFQELTGLPNNQVIGLGGELDRARLVQNIANELGIHHSRIKNAQVIGQHGKNMVPVFSQIEILDENGKNPRKLTDILSQDKLVGLREKTILASDVLIELLETSDHKAPAAAINKMVMAITNGMPIVASARSSDDEAYVGRPVHFVNGKCELLPLPELSFTENVWWEDAKKACSKAMTTLRPTGHGVG